MGKIRERIIAYILAFCTLVSAICTGITMPVFAEEDGTKKESDYLANFEVYRNGEPLKEGEELRDGDELEITLNWYLAEEDGGDEVTVPRTFTIDITPVNNVEILDMEINEPIIWHDKSIGYFNVTDGKLIIYIDSEEFLKSKERKGGATIKGQVAVKGGLDQEGKQTIVIGDYEKDITYKSSETESSLGGWKSVKDNTGVKKVGDNYYQTFQVTMNAYNGDITLNDVDDHLGSGFIGSIFDFSIVEYPSGLEELLRGVSSLDDLKTILSREQGITIPGGEKLVIEYTVEVSKDIYKQDGGNLDYKNTFSAEYTTSAKRRTSNEYTASAYANKPTVKKEGKLQDDGQTVEWKITIELNDWKDKSFEDIIGEIKDTLDPGFDVTGITISKEDFDQTFDGSGIWVATYYTRVTSDIVDSPSGTWLNNEVSVNIDGNEYTATGSVYVDGRDWIEKEAIEYDPDTKLITWNVTLHVPETPVKNVTVRDLTEGGYNFGQHELYTTIEVDGKTVVENDLIVDGNGNIIDDNYGNVKDDSNGNGIIGNYNNHWGKAITFLDEYIAEHKGKTITITFKTKVTDDDIVGKTYRNKATLSYTDVTLDRPAPEQNVVADWKQAGNALAKEGTPAKDKNAIDYTLAISLEDISGLKASGSIVVTDVLPEGLVLDKSSVKVQDIIYGGVDGRWGKDTYPDRWAPNYVASTMEEPEIEGNTITFTIPVDQHTLDNMEFAKADHNGDGHPYIHITYTAIVEDPEVFTAEEYRDYENTAEAKYNGKEIGTATNITRLTPKQAVVKDVKYGEETNLDALYTIVVNPDALDLSADSDWLEAEDFLGSALNYDLSSIKVEKNIGGDSWVELKLDKNEYAYSFDTAQNALKFRLPDKTHLKITYAAKVNLAYTEKPRDASGGESSAEGGVPDEKSGKLTPENSTNRFQLSGFTSSPTSSEAFLNTSVLRPKGWAEAMEGSITIGKFYTDEDGQMRDLNGATFKLEKVVDNEFVSSDSSMKPKSLEMVEESITVDSEDNNNEETILHLALDQIYVLTELSAPEGYKRTEPYYFIIPGSQNVTLPEGLNGHAWPSGYTLLIENVKISADEQETLGSLTIQKTVTGLTWDEAIAGGGSWSFEITDGTGMVVDSATISAGNFDGEGNVRSHTISGLKPGPYTVTETVTSPEGYTCSTTYSVNVDEKGKASVTVEAGKESTISVTNTYEQLGSLTLTKTIEGGLTWSKIKETISFMISYEGDAAGFPMTILGDDPLWVVSDTETSATYTLNNLPPGTYTVEEIVSDKVTSDKVTSEKEYVLTNVTYQIGGEDSVECDTEAEHKITSDISVTNDAPASVTFTNTYAANEGSLTLQKEIKGILDGEGQEVSGEAAWNAVRESLTFKVWRYDTEKEDYVLYQYIEVRETPGNWVVDPQTGYAVRKLENLPVGKYKVEEISGNLDNYTVQRTAYVVVPSDAESLSAEKEDTKTGELEVKLGQNVEVTFTNTYTPNKAELVLEKTIVGLPGADDPEAVWNMVKEKLEFVITDTSTDGIPITIEGTHKDWHYDDESSSYKITISLPPGTYKVTETITGDLRDYTWKSASYTVTVTDKENATKQGSAQSGSIQDRGEITVSDITLATDDSATVSLSNTYERNKGTLKLTKKIVGLSEAQIQELLSKDETITFTIKNIEGQEAFTYTCTLAGFKPDQEEGTYTLTLEGDKMLPTGTYRIVESNFGIAGYETKVQFDVKQPNGQQGRSGDYDPEDLPAFDIATGNNAEVTFTNIYTAIPGKLTLQKTVSGDLGWSAVKDSIYFVIDYDKGNAVDPDFPMTITGKDSRWNESPENVYTLTLEGLEPREYTVTESATKDGYTCTTTYTVNRGRQEADSDGKVKVTVISGSNSTVEIENNYVRDKGNLTIVKLLEGVSYDLAKSEVTFTVTNTDTGETFDSPYVLSGFTKDELQQGRYTLTVEDLPTGNYKVEETISSIDGYVIESVTVTYTVIGGVETTQTTNGGVPDTAPEVEIKKGENTTVIYQNIYEEDLPDTGDLVIRKTVVGEKTWDVVKGILKFEVSGGNIEGVLTIRATEFKLGDGVYTYTIHNRTPGEYTVKEIIDGQETDYSRITTYTVGSANTTGLPYNEETGVKVNVSANEDNIVAFTNNYSLDRGNLTITKTVEGPVPEADVKKITFTVKSEGPLADGLTYNETFTLGDERGENIFRYEDGKYILELKNLLVGKYTVTEEHYNFAGFITKKVSYQVNADGEVILVEDGEEKSKDPAKVTVVKAEEAKVAYKDVYIEEPKGSLVLEKSITGARGWAQINGNISFEVKLGNVVIRTYNLSEFKDDDGDGIYTYTIPNLALGTYTVTEIIIKDEDGYTRSTSYQVNNGITVTDNLTAQIELQEGSDNKVTFTNDYERDMGTLIITKTIDGAIPEDEIKAALSFKVTDTVTKTSTTYSLESINSKNGVYTLELPKPTGTYEITEILTDINGWIWRETTYTINGSGKTSGFTSTAQVNKGEETTVAYTNRYEENAGSLVIQKLVSKQDPNDSVISWDYVKNYLTFVITDENGDTTEIKPKEVDFIGPDGNNMYYYIVTGLEGGKTYTVTETLYNVPNYSCTVTYTGDNIKERLSETAAKVTVGEEGAKITFTNTYKANEVTSSSGSSSSNSSNSSSGSTSSSSPSPAPAPSQTPAQSPSPSPGKQLQVSPTPAPSVGDGTVLAAERDRVPQTSDYFAMWLSLFFVSLSSLIGYLSYLDKKKREE